MPVPLYADEVLDCGGVYPKYIVGLLIKNKPCQERFIYLVICDFFLTFGRKFSS